MQAPQETWIWSLHREDPLEEGTATHSSILPMDRGTWRATVHRVSKSQIWLSMHARRHLLGVRTSERGPANMKLIPEMSSGAITFHLWLAPGPLQQWGCCKWAVGRQPDGGCLWARLVTISLLPSRFHRRWGRLEPLVCLQCHLREWQPETDPVLWLCVYCNRV